MLGIFLAYTAYPAFASSPRDRIPLPTGCWRCLQPLPHIFSFSIANWRAVPACRSRRICGRRHGHGVAASNAAHLGLLAVVALVFRLCVFRSSPLVPDIIRWVALPLAGRWMRCGCRPAVFGVPLGSDDASSFCSCCLARCRQGCRQFFIKLFCPARSYARRPGQGSRLSSMMTE